MNSPNKKVMLLLSLVAVLAIGVATGCARKQRTPPDLTERPAPTPSPSVTYVNERAVLVHRGDDSSRRYYRDDNGKLYYVDQNGAVHTIERNARVERGSAGLYYIVDDDNVNYYTDKSGRLYYRDTTGRDVYIEDSGAGRVIDPLPILRGDTYPRIEHVRSLQTCNDAWRKCSNKCNDGIGLGSNTSCLENCDYQREQCLKPY